MAECEQYHLKTAYRQVSEHNDMTLSYYVTVHVIYAICESKFQIPQEFANGSHM